MSLPSMKHASYALLLTASAALSACSGSNRTPNGNACSPNPCNEAQKNLCVVEDGNARCLCNAGFVARPDGRCEEISTANCPEHPGDSDEPDDCQSRARAITLSSEARSRSIDPAGDYDFFRFDAQLDDIYAVDVQAQGSLYPRIDVFDQGGLFVGSSEFLSATRFSFKAISTAPYFVRVSHSPLDPSVGTGDYTITVSKIGTDDVGDSPQRATSIAPNVSGDPSPRVFDGRFEYPYDSDWYGFSGTTTSRYVLAFDAGRQIPTVAYYASADAQSPQFVTTQATIEFFVPVNGTGFLALYPTSGEGSYSFTFFRD